MSCPLAAGSRRRALLAGAAALLANGGRAGTARAQGAAETRRGGDAASAGWAVAPFVGYAAHSPVRFWGLTPGRNHFMLGAQFVRPLARRGGLTLAYAPNVVPVFVLSNNPHPGSAGLTGPGITAPAPTLPGAAPPGTVLPLDDTPTAACEAVRCGPVYGFGVAPAGLRLEARLLRGLAVYGAVAGGLVLFGRNVPVTEARRLNATAEWGGGVLVRAGVGAAVQVGYKYHHLSNAYTAVRNPGVDGRVFYAGVQWRRARSPAPLEPRNASARR